MFCPLCLCSHTRFRFRIKGESIRECVACLALFTPSLMPASALRPRWACSGGNADAARSLEAEEGEAPDGSASGTGKKASRVPGNASSGLYDHGYLSRETAGAKGARACHGYYDYEAERALHERNHAALFQLIGDRGRGRSVLDIGCASGHLLASARARGFEVMGIDASAEAIARMRDERRIEGVAGDVCAVEIPRRFDVITLVETIEHFPDPARAFRTITRWLKPGGRIVVVTGDCRAPLARLLGPFWWYLIPPDHIVYYNPRAMALFSARHGLVIDRWARQASHWVSSRNVAMKAARTLRLRADLGLSLARRIPDFPTKVIHGTTFLVSLSYPR